MARRISSNYIGAGAGYSGGIGAGLNGLGGLWYCGWRKQGRTRFAMKVVVVGKLFICNTQSRRSQPNEMENFAS
jgi:hypothetical protein